MEVGGRGGAAEEGVDQKVIMSHHEVRSQAFKLMRFIISVPLLRTCDNIENKSFSLGDCCAWKCTDPPSSKKRRRGRRARAFPSSGNSNVN